MEIRLIVQLFQFSGSETRAFDFIAHKCDAIAGIITEVDVFAGRDLLLDLLELRNLLGTLVELGGLVVPGHREAAVFILTGRNSNAVNIELGGDIAFCSACDDRRDYDPALGHNEGVGIADDRGANLVGLNPKAVTVAGDFIIAEDVIAVRKGIAVFINSHQIHSIARGGLLNGLIQLVVQVRAREAVIGRLVKRIYHRELRRHRQDVVALRRKSDFHIDIIARHGKGIAERIDAGRGAVLGHDQIAGLVAGIGLGNNCDFRTLGRMGDWAAVDLKIEGAVIKFRIGSLYIEGIGRNGFECDFHIDVHIGHDECVGAADRKRSLCRVGDHLPVIGVDSGDLIVGIVALDHNRSALDGGLHGHVVDGGGSLAAVVCRDVDVMTVFDLGVHTDIAARHDKGVAGEMEICLAVGLLDRQTLDGLAGLGVSHDSDLRAGRGSGDSLAVHVEEHRAVGGGHAARQLVELGSGGAGRGSGAVAVRDGGRRGRRGGAAGIAGAGHRDRQRHGIVEPLARGEVRQVVGLVQHLKQRLVGVVVDAVGGRDAVSGIAAADLVLHDAVAGGADGRADRRRDDQGLSRSDLGPVGDAVDLLDKRREDVEVHAQAVAHAGDVLARGHGVGHQVVGEAVC